MEAFWDKDRREIIDAPEQSQERIADIDTTWGYIRDWNDHDATDVTSLVQTIVDIRHSDTDDRLARLCVDSPILEDAVYEWLLNDPLFIDMQLYRKEIAGRDSLSSHHEAVRILIQLQAYLQHSNAAYDDMTKLFKHISASGH